MQRSLISFIPIRSLQYQIKTRNIDPPYLSAKPQLPLYPTIQLDLRGPDFVALESFGRYLRKFFRKNSLRMTSFPLPARQISYKIYHPNSTNVRKEFTMANYHRVHRIYDIKAVQLPSLLDLIYQNLPEGVTLIVDKADPRSDEERFVPQLEVHALRQELSKLTT